MKVILARKFLSKNPFTKYMPKNISEKWAVYHEDFKKMESVAAKWRQEGYSVKVIEAVEET